MIAGGFAALLAAECAGAQRGHRGPIRSAGRGLAGGRRRRRVEGHGGATQRAGRPGVRGPVHPRCGARPGARAPQCPGPRAASGASRRLSFDRRGPAPRESSIGADVALGDREPHLIERLSEPMVREFALDDQDLEGLRTLEITSTVVVPLRARRQALGALTLSVGRISGRSYGPDDLAFFVVLAGRVALALDNAGLTRQISDLERQLDSALGGLDEAVTMIDRQGRPVYANRAAVELVGAASAEEFCAADPARADGPFRDLRRGGQPDRAGGPARPPSAGRRADRPAAGRAERRSRRPARSAGWSTGPPRSPTRRARSSGW